MKAFIDGVEMEVKTVENMGFQGGYQVKAVLVDGKERILIKKNGKWQTRTVDMRFYP